MRSAFVLVAATLIVSACADGPAPVPAAPKTAAVMPAAPTAAAAPAVTSWGNAITPELQKKALSVGYFPRTRKGIAVFCRKDADIGTRIPTEKCIGENELAETVQRALEAKENLRHLRQGERCSSPSCGT